MAEMVRMPSCVCNKCLAFRAKYKNRTLSFDLEKCQFHFDYPNICEDEPKPFQYEIIIRTIEGRQKTDLEQSMYEVVRFFTYSTPDVTTCINFESLAAIADFLERENMRVILKDDTKLARDFLRKACWLSAVSWHAYVFGCEEAEYAARVLRRFLGALVSVPKIAELVVEVFTDVNYWPSTLYPITMVKSMAEDNLACQDTATLLCNLTRIDHMPYILAAQANLVEIIDKKFYECCKWMPRGRSWGAIMLHILGNMVQVDGIIKIITESNSGYFMEVTLPKLMTDPYLPLVVERAVWPFLRNLSLTDDGRTAIMKDIDSLLGLILYPIAGPEEIPPEEAAKLPLEVQFLPENKIRVDDLQVRECILDILFSLCRFKKDRETLRNYEIYEILKAYHFAEEQFFLEQKLEDLINLLIRFEDTEISVDDILDGLILEAKAKALAAQTAGQPAAVDDQPTPGSSNSIPVETETLPTPCGDPEKRLLAALRQIPGYFDNPEPSRIYPWTRPGTSVATQTSPEVKKPDPEEKPAAEDNKPAAEGNIPAAEDNKPATENNKPAPGANKVAPNVNKPTLQGSKSAPNVNKPTSAASKPGQRVNKPTLQSSKSAPNVNKPTSQASKPAPRVNKPASAASKPALNSKKPTSVAGKPAPNANKPASAASKPGPNAYKPTSAASKPGPNANKLTSAASKPGPNANKPTSQASKPAPRVNKPASAASKPALNANKPTSVAGKPAPNANKPASAASKPGLNANKPTSAATKPAPKVNKPNSEESKPAGKGNKSTSGEAK